MNYPDTTDDDLAEDELSSIISMKEDLTVLIDNSYRTNAKQDDLDHMASVMEDHFDDAFSTRWYQLMDISGSLEFPRDIPSCAALRSKMREEHKRFRPQPTPPSNPATLIAMGEDL